MAEGIVGGILGDEEERPELENMESSASETLAGADPFAATIVHQQALYSPEVAHEASKFLQIQTQHVEIQSRHVHVQTKLLKDEHDLRLAHLRNQLSEETVRRLGLRLRVSFQIFLAAVATAIGITGAFMVHDAVLSRSVIIDAFELSPNLVTHVPSGKIIATGLFDVLARIQAATRTSAERRSLSNAWTNDIGIEVPETGISVGQIERTLKARFGHDQHINGDVVQTETGALALTVRGTGILAKTFTDADHNLDKLLNDAGEYIYGQSQPGLWVNYLTNAGRNDEAIRFAQTAYPTVDAPEKPYVLNYWANAIIGKGDRGAMQEALPLYQETLRLKPDYWGGYNNIIYALWNMGSEEASIREGEHLTQMAGGRPGRAPETMYQNYDQQLWDLTAVRAESIADMESHDGVGIFASFSGSANLQVAQTESLLHDIDSATLRVKTTSIDEQSAPDVAIATLTKALLAEEVGDIKQAAKEWDAFAVAYNNPTVSTSNAPYLCYAAPAYEKTAQSAKADAALNGPLKANGTGSFVDCYRFKADVLDLRGDWAGAQSWYTKAQQLAPSIPSGYYSYGMALVRHGDLKKAAEQFRQANLTGPHWADPLKAWGDVLMQQHLVADALEKYDEAVKYAPKWKQLTQARLLAVKARG